MAEPEVETEAELRHRKKTDESSAATTDEKVNGGGFINSLKKGMNMDAYVPADTARVQKLIQAASNSAPPALVPYIKKMEPFLAILVTILGYMLPFYMFLWDQFDTFMRICPPSLFRSVCGLLMCFFGGVFPTLIAAFEAWNMAGGKSARDSLGYCYAEFKRLRAVNSEDNTVDDDNDGIADVDQITAKELFQRKISMVLVAADPNKLSDALAGVYTGWIGVVAALKIEFAKTIALGAAIGDTLKKPASYFAVPLLTHLLPEKYHKWIDVIIGYTVKTIAVSIAWTIQKIISTVHSGIRGGLMAARGVVTFLSEKGLIPFDNDSYVDEVFGCILAFCGIYVQFFWLNLTLPWFLSLLLWPFEFAEAYIIWTISE